MQDIITHGMALIQHNQFASGGLLLGALAGMVAYLRGVPNALMSILRRQFMVHIDIVGTNSLYPWVEFWLDNHPYTNKARLLSASLKFAKVPGEFDSDGDPIMKPRVMFTPAPGQHIMRYKNTFFWLNRSRDRNKDGSGYTEMITLTFLGRSIAPAKDLFIEIESLQKDDKGKTMGIWSSNNRMWLQLMKRVPRPLDSVLLREDHTQRILADFSDFKKSENWYINLGLPYRRGYLFYGPPGNGKSSFASALAGYFGKDLYILNLAVEDMDDYTLGGLMMEVPHNGIILLEDIDRIFTGREKHKDDCSKVTFSGLLNALDGVSAKEGQILIMSTNHIESLDPALIRPGRVDFKLEFENATQQQASALFLRFFPDSKYAEGFGKRMAGLSMAAIQSILIANKSSDEDAYQASNTIEGTAVDVLRLKMSEPLELMK